MLAINLIFIFVDFEKYKWIKNRPRLLKMLNKYKIVRKTLLVPILFLLLFSSIISNYGLNAIIIALLKYKSLDS